jgi:5,10-methylenetetrahydromethanopterin reductase
MNPVHAMAATESDVRLPKLSLRLHGGMTPTACVEMAKVAEREGLEGVWFAENAFGRGILPAAAACAVATRRLRIGAGVFNPFSRHPTLMAMEIGALDELSAGRASISVGSGIASQVAKIGHSVERPVAALGDTLTILRALLRGELADHGGALCAHKVKLDFTPRADIPIYLAGRGDLSVKLCGSHADGLVVSNMCSAGFSARAAQILSESWRTADRTGHPAVIQYLPCSVDENRDRAIEAGKRAVGAMLPNYWALAQRIRFARMGLLLDTGLSESEVAEAAGKIGAGDDPVKVLDERYTAAFAVAGTPNECLAAAGRYAEANVTELALTVGSSDPHREIALLGAAARKARTS